MFPIIGREQLNKWEREQESLAYKRTGYGIKISKKKLFNGLHTLNPTEKVVYLGLRLYADRRGYCWPSVRLLARGLNLHRTTISKSIINLQNKNILTISSLKGKTGKRYSYLLKI